MKIAFSATLISHILWATLSPFHIRAAAVCPNFSTEETCISNSESREVFKSPCVWCCGNKCKGGKWKCEPLSFLTDYLENQVGLTNWDGKGMTRYGNACGPDSEVRLDYFNLFNGIGVAYLEVKSKRLLASVGKQGLRGIRVLDTSETETPL
mmetsp:Transcript_2345/g.5003  ORF Transcript_2345/g.5003 Transcript_2345/m.5003 type:complete len:152 (+) Transcript_2345:425-880(+)